MVDDRMTRTQGSYSCAISEAGWLCTVVQFILKMYTLQPWPLAQLVDHRPDTPRLRVWSLVGAHRRSNQWMHQSVEQVAVSLFWDLSLSLSSSLLPHSTSSPFLSLNYQFKKSLKNTHYMYSLCKILLNLYKREMYM